LKSGQGVSDRSEHFNKFLLKLSCFASNLRHG
jgi:hypothetical protein